MSKYRKKPVVIEAIRLKHGQHFVRQALIFMGEDDVATKSKAEQEMFSEYYKLCEEDGGIIIPTLEGDHLARWGDYIIKGVNGEFYPCKPDIFKKTYESVGEEN